MLGPSEGGLGGQDDPDGFPASGRNAYPSGAKAFFADGSRRSEESLVKEPLFALAIHANAAVRGLLVVPTTGTVPGCEDSRSFSGCSVRKCHAGVLVPPLQAYCFLPIVISIRPPSHFRLLYRNL